MPSKCSLKPRKLPQQERSRLTVEAILEATTHILTEKGYDKTNTNLIAERAGVSIGSLYQYFPNKKSLIVALREEHSKEIAELLAAKFNHLFDSPPEIAIPELVKAVIAVHAINPRLHQVLSEEIPYSERSQQQMQKTDEQITELLRAYLERWRERFALFDRDRLRPQNIEMTIFIINRTVESLCHSAVIEHPQFVSDSQFEQEVSNLLMSYLIKKPD
ncbi:MAG: TetR/AcrR family transcriptional regulator [Xenococcaceae cyanobacterium MO_188.B29]|nr:TetR/AcrR family transcriptional regulator [Xenococcaceae cyanobacterium MO_188.B29]